MAKIQSGINVQKYGITPSKMDHCKLILIEQKMSNLAQLKLLNTSKKPWNNITFTCTHLSNNQIQTSTKITLFSTLRITTGIPTSLPPHPFFCSFLFHRIKVDVGLATEFLALKASPSLAASCTWQKILRESTFYCVIACCIIAYFSIVLMFYLLYM